MVEEVVQTGHWALATVTAMSVVSASAPAQSGKRGSEPADVVGAVGAQPGMTIADVGCGNGWLSAAMSEAVGGGGRVYAVDIGERWVQKVRERGLPNVEAVLSEPHDVSLPPESVDVAFLHDVASHVKRDARARFYASLALALKPDGSLVIFKFHGKARALVRELAGYGFLAEQRRALWPLPDEELDTRARAGLRFRYRPRFAGRF